MSPEFYEEDRYNKSIEDFNSLVEDFDAYKVLYVVREVIIGGRAKKIINPEEAPVLDDVSNLDISAKIRYLKDKIDSGHPLNKCLECSSELVQSIYWEAHGKESWSIKCRCPECELHIVLNCNTEKADKFDDILTKGDEILYGNMCELERKNMEEDVEQLVKGIYTDNIKPMDF